jgi:hypothetical protein
MMQASIVTFNRHHGKRDISETWIINAETLAVSPELKTQIVNKLDEFRKIRSKKRPVNFRTIVFIVIAINAVRLISGNWSDNSSRFQNMPVTFTNPPNDSLLRKLADSINHLNHPDLRSINPSAPSH